MGDNEYQQSFRGLSDHDFASRSLSLTEHQSQHGLENPAAAHYQAPMTMAPSQPSSLAVKTGQPSLNHMEPMHYQTPMTMWHHVPSQQSNLAAMSMIPQAQQQNAAALSMMLQSQGLRYYPAPVKLFPQALQQTQNSQFYHASVACSKRFSEEEKQKLEKVFTDETQKPSTSRKRQLAEELGCPVPKVNVGQRCSPLPDPLLMMEIRTGSRTEGLERNRCIECRLTRPARQQIGQLPGMTAPMPMWPRTRTTRTPSTASPTA